MREIIKKYSDACIISREDGKYFLSVDVGHFAEVMETVEINEEQLNQAMSSQLAAEEVFIKIQNEKNKNQHTPPPEDGNPFQF